MLCAVLVLGQNKEGKKRKEGGKEASEGGRKGVFAFEFLSTMT